MKKRIIAFLCLIVLLIGLAGCSGSDRERCVGKWERTVNVADIVNEKVRVGLKLAFLEDMASYLKLDDFSILLTLELREDGSYTAQYDPDSVEAAIEALKEPVREGIIAFYEQQMKNSNALSMTLDQFLGLSGTSIDDIMNGAISHNLQQEIEAELEKPVEGTWRARMYKLTLSNGLPAGGDDTSYDIKLMGDEELILTGQSDADNEIRFEKVK